MLDVSYTYDVPDPGPGRKGFTQVLRTMHRGGSVEIPLAKKPSVYSAAKAAGVKVRVRNTDKGTVRVWRVDGPERAGLFDDGLGIFGQPIVEKNILS